MSTEHWNEGYVTELNYTSGYYLELNPERLKFVMLVAGYKPPKIINACELGFGNGVSISIHENGNNINWYGNDFNPSQVINAQQLIGEENKLRIFDDSFEDFCDNENLPNFDYIGLHGIWSWVSKANWNHIVNFIKKKLNPGGIVYISHNCIPGWNNFAPIRELMLEVGDGMNTIEQSLNERFDSAVGFIKKLHEVDARYIKANETIMTRINNFPSSSKEYLIHEYFNRNWRPTSFKEMADILQPAKLNHLSSAHPLDLVDDINLTKEQVKFISGLENKVIKESSRDIITQQSFRRDIWAKGAVSLSKDERNHLLKDVRLIKSLPSGKFDYTVRGSLGQAKVSPKIYDSILSIMNDYKVKSISELADSLAPNKINQNQLMQAILILLGVGQLSIVSEGSENPVVINKAHNFNKSIIAKNMVEFKQQYLCSPVTGGGVMVDQFHQLFLQQHKFKSVEKSKLIDLTLSFLKQKRQKIVSKGRVVTDENEELNEIEKLVEKYVNDYLQIYKALKLL